MITNQLDIVECPRDAMQGLTDFVPTSLKAQYINKLLEVGFHTIDFGSFVSPKAVPQMRDTGALLEQLRASSTKLLAIVANRRGVEDALLFPEIDYLGFPLSINETFQQRNTGKSISEALGLVEEIQRLVIKNNKKLVVYLSMAFGNPYEDPYHADDVLAFTEKLKAFGIEIVSVSDTIGVSTPDKITRLLTPMVEEFDSMTIGAHLHATPDTVVEKTKAVLESGCLRLDTALMGYGGCPLAADNLTGNMATEVVLRTLESVESTPKLNQDAFKEAMIIAQEVFAYH